MVRGAKQLLKMTSGYTYKIYGIIFCTMFILLLILGKMYELYLLTIMSIIILVIIVSLIKEFHKIKRILQAGEVLITKIITLERTYYGLKYEFKLRTGDVFIESSYYDQNTGKQYLFKSYCDGKYFRSKQKFWEDDLLKLDCQYVKVYVNKNNFNEYVFLLDEV